ncbi:hypothetical protein ACFXOY_28190 [Streptomyces niveus]|uniref:hypothetical protein n=1 Tax=Streptomyces niveus TaxID=193462 RepID=UPI00367637BE
MARRLNEKMASLVDCSAVQLERYSEEKRMKTGSEKKLVIILGAATLTSVVGVLATMAGVFDWALWQSAAVFGAAGLLSGSIAVVRRSRQNQP